MTVQDRTTAFHNFLRSRGIGEYSPAIPEGVGKHLNGIPIEQDLVKIPEVEQFPLPKVQKSERLDEAEMRKMFTQAQLEDIVLEGINGSQDENELNVPTLEIPGEYSSVGHFVLCKTELNTYYNIQSEEMKLPVAIGVCKEPQCMNSTVPSFDYCITHLKMDPKFSEQGFIKGDAEQPASTA